MTIRSGDGQDKVALDELAARLKAGEPGAALKLWEAVRRFVELKARDRVRAPGCRAQADDLIQAGFLAVLDTAARYEPGEDKNFLHTLSFSLRKAFSAEEGTRSTRRDVLQYADSTEAAAYQDDPEGPTMGELLPDDGAALAFMGVEYADFLDYCRREIGAALDTLPPEYAALLRVHYLEGRTLEEAAPLCGFASKQTASDAEKRERRRLGRGSHRRALRDCLESFNDFRECQEAADRETWRHTGMSWTEAAALVKTGRGETVNQRKRAFCEAYLISGNATDAAREAGYSPRSARSIGQRLLTFDDVREYLEQRNQEISAANTAQMEEVRQFWTATMRNENTKPADRLKASELLAKAYGAFLDRVEMQGDFTLRKSMAALSEEELRALARLDEGLY